MPAPPTSTASRLLLALLTVIPLVATACSVARPLRPLAQGGWAVEASAPLLLAREEAYPLPVGNVTLGGRYGLGHQLEVRGDLHLLPLGWGIVGLDAGLLWHPIAARGLRPALHLSAEGNLLTKPALYGDADATPVTAAVELGTVAHWEPTTKLWPYLVFDNAIDTQDGDWLPTLAAGLQWWLSERSAVGFELGWTAFNYPHDSLGQRYTAPFERGAVTVGLAFTLQPSLPAGGAGGAP